MIRLDFQSICAITESYEQSVVINKINFGICQDLSTASVLSRLVYWFSPSKRDGQLRTKIRKDGKNWLARQDDEWLEEACVTKKQMARIKRELVSLGLVETKVFMFNGKSTTHWCLSLKKYAELYNLQIEKLSKKDCGIPRWGKAECPDGVKRNTPMGESHNNNIKHSSYTSPLVNVNNVSQNPRLSECSTAAQRVLLEKEDCFDTEQSTVHWLQQFGFKRGVANKIMRDYSAYQLMSAREYLNDLLNSGHEIKSSITGYFLRTLEHEWYLPDLE